MVTRRHFLAAGLGLASAPTLGWALTPEVKLLSPASRNGQHFFAGLNLSATEPLLTPLPVRGHGLLLDPRRTDEALIIARRPGTLAIKFNRDTGRILHQWPSGEDRHFFGHAVYSADGSTLFVTENNIDTGQGLVTVHDAQDFRLRAEYRTHGIGPHELLLMPDGVTLAVANGGIRTLPETGRVKLNRGRIETSLVYLDSRDGRLVGKFVLPSTQQSLRHLAVTPDGQVAAALQYEGDKKQAGVPLMVFHDGKSPLQYAEAPQPAWDRMRHYAASVAYDPLSDRFALTCPLGNILACWTSDGEYAGSIEVPKVSGVAFRRGQGFASNESGEVYKLDLLALTATRHAQYAGMQWDNHLYLGDT